MLKALPSLICALLLCAVSSAQEFHITGKLVDEISQKPLEAATIYVESIQDSTLISYTISDSNGFFELEGKTKQEKANLFFTFNGYKTLKMTFDLKKEIDLGTVKMDEQVEELKGVQVTGERTPITVKKDTLEFNADSFKTRPDATVEDVLKKLPGVEVDNEGKITVNGKEVNQVLVNGQVFFSNDPKVATKSLPKEIISKIQITNTKTKEEEFSGDEGDGENKTINLTIKEDKNKGYLGRVSAGYGTDERYQANGLLNYFDNKERFSVLGSSNNINNPGFSFDEIYDLVGNSGTRSVSVSDNGGFSIGNLSFGFGQGITTSSVLGASYANQKKDVYEVNGNYFYSNSDSFNDQRTSRENILPDGRFFTDTESIFNGITNTHQLSGQFEYDIDKTLRISIEPGLTINNTNSENQSTTVSTDENQAVINQNETLTLDDNEQRNFSNNLRVFKKLDTLGSYVRFSFDNRNIKNESRSDLNTLQEVFGTTPSSEARNQRTNQDNSNDFYELGVSYRQSLGNKFFLDLEYEYRNRTQDNERLVFDFDPATGQFSNFNDLLSSDFNFTNAQQRPSLGFRRRGKKFSFRIRADYINTNLDNQDILQNTSFSNGYDNLLFGGSLSYQISRSKSLSFFYNSNLSVPSVNQLQPIPNVNNPLNIIIGNPNLNPSISRRLYLNYNNYDWKTRSGFFVYASVDFQDDQVSPVTTTDADFLRTTRYVNVDGNYNAYGGASYSKQIKKDSVFTAKFNFRPFFNLNKNVGFTNGERLETKQFRITPRVSTSFNFREVVEVEPEYSITFNNTTYNLDIAGLDDINFISHNVGLKTTTYWPKNIVWGNDINYNYNGNVGPGFDKDALFWNMSLGYQFLKKNATLKVLAYDLLNQNINTRRTTGVDFIQDFQGTVLQRYFMLSFTFKFDQFGGKKSRNSGFSF
ncbi:outer membrane beta-barrel protein [Spongiimicrobium salis]|uniref:outer membrane beta-barrel protein n=1 Tax=Spongiimicrobium salis TaxID=1667022 RepID=UPI00374D517F